MSARTSALVRRKTAVVLLRLLLVVAVLFAWWYATGPGGVSGLILPDMSSFAEAFVDVVTTPSMWGQMLVTLGEMAAAFVIAAGAGLAAGFLLSRSRVSAMAFEPMFAWGYMLPFALLYPLFLLWLGAGVESKIFYAAAGAFFPIAFNTMRGLRTVDARFVTVGRAFRASPMQMDFFIKAGAAQPMILAGLRIGLSVVSISVVLAELLGSTMGLGHEIHASQSRLRSADTYALVAVLLLVTGTLQVLVERLLRPRQR
ncbi:ABC transporter permease [Microbacterium marinilacus]|uniref:ABC transmembrane type-1 domain-containing protein n=1 Tax=Microbacterium marinilacus TaxID=415209 RepID=A0ABP7BTP6_9MICO|nr:ABC transporter permease subunit [Microbacterium marinilacus]MBY0688233.1 ABC transporter permease subunit [Microbacterium marinilacus]